jgi:hypothetical protein
MKKARYNSFDKGAGQDFEKEKLFLENQIVIVSEVSEPSGTGDKQKLWEQL